MTSELFEIVKKLGFGHLLNQPRKQNLPELANQPTANDLPIKQDLPALVDQNAARTETAGNYFIPQKKTSFFDTVAGDENESVNSAEVPDFKKNLPPLMPDLVPDAPKSPVSEALGVPQIPFGGVVNPRPNLPPLIADEPLPTRPRIVAGADNLPPLENRAQTETPATTPRAVLPELPSMETQAKIDAINNKQYENLKDEKGNLRRDENGKVIHGKDRNDKWSAGEKFLGAALGALSGLARGGVGGAIAGGIEGGIDRNAIAKFKDARELPALITKQQRQAEAEKKRLDYVNAQQKAADERRSALISQQNGIVDFNRKNLDILKLKNKELVESIQADDLVTPEEVELAKKEGITLLPYDRRSFETEARGGTTFERPKLGGGQWSVSGTNQKTPTGALPIDEEKVLRDWRGSWQGKDEQPYRLTNKQIADIELAIKQGDVQRAQDIAKYNSSQNFETQKFNANKISETQKFNATNLNKWNSDTIQRIIDESKTQGTVFAEEAAAKGFASRIERYTAELNKIDPNDTSEETTERRNKLTRGINALQSKLDATLGKSQAAKTILETMQQNRPPRPEQINPVTVKTPAPLKPASIGRGRQGRTYSRSDIDRVIRQ
jgi:hypothetical protein